MLFCLPLGCRLLLRNTCVIIVTIIRNNHLFLAVLIVCLFLYPIRHRDRTCGLCECKRIRPIRVCACVLAAHNNDDDDAAAHNDLTTFPSFSALLVINRLM